jgi:hypothetical protein
LTPTGCINIFMKFFSIFFISTAGFAAAFAPMGSTQHRRIAAATVPVVMIPRNMIASDDEYYINEERRSTMNLILVSSAAATFTGLAIPFFAFFVPPGVPGGGGVVNAKDILGNDLYSKKYLATKPALDRSLVQGLKADAT